MVLTDDNYYSKAADREFMSVSQYKSFAGTYGKQSCEFRAMAELNGDFEEEPTTALLVGSYVDRYFEGTLDSFKKENPSLFRKDGTLKADFAKADAIIERIERDPTS